MAQRRQRLQAAVGPTGKTGIGCDDGETPFRAPFTNHGTEPLVERVEVAVSHTLAVRRIRGDEPGSGGAGHVSDDSLLDLDDVGDTGALGVGSGCVDRGGVTIGGLDHEIDLSGLRLRSTVDTGP